MRQIFYLLVILNLLLFLWIMQYEQQSVQQQAGHPVIGELQIVSEQAAGQGVPDRMPADGEEKFPPESAPYPGAQRVTATPGVTPQCTVLGPVATYMQAKLIHQQLARYDVSSSISSDVVSSINSFEVMLPPLRSRYAATSKLRELQQSGIEDAHMIRTGKQRKGISFGSYHFRDDAERRLLGVAQFAENPVIIERKDVSEVFLVEMDTLIEESLTADQVKTIRDKFSRVRLHKTSCDNRD